MKPHQEDIDQLRELEESLWRPETRFDREYMDKVLASEFFEFGRSGRRYTREQILDTPSEEIKVELPHEDFRINIIDEKTYLVTYTSKVMYEELEIANRSSLWTKTETGWKLWFHQGTATQLKK
jgi:hypothetical protein